jgi:hypothetical protein
MLEMYRSTGTTYKLHKFLVQIGKVGFHQQGNETLKDNMSASWIKKNSNDTGRTRTYAE